MSPKRNVAVKHTKTVTIYNSAGKRDRKMSDNNLKEQNGAEKWELYFKMADIELVKSIIKSKDITGVPLIIGAAVLNQKELLLTLLKHGYNIDDTDKNHITPLVWAVKLKHLEMIQALLQNDADCTIRPQNGDDIACIALSSSLWDEESFLSLFNYLKKRGCLDVNAINKNGLSLLHLAVRREWNDLINILFQNDVNVNISTADGVTPLMLASYRNDFTIVTRLLNHNASIKRRNADGFTALCYAFWSAITKELEPPFLVIDRLQIELAKQKIDMTSYLKKRVKIILNASKIHHPDQPSPEQMLSHIVIFILKNVDKGFELFLEVSTANVIKDALEKFMDDKLNLKLPLVVMNTIFKHTKFTLDVKILIAREFINGGCFNACLKVMRMYEEEPTLLQLAATPIIIFSVGYSVAQSWYELNKHELRGYLPKYELCMHSIDANYEQIIFIREQLEDFKNNICNIKSTTLINAMPLKTEKEMKPNSNSKKAKRRTKALKAKITKIKNSELTARYNKCGDLKMPHEAGFSVLNNDPADSEEEVLCSTAVKMAMDVLDDKYDSDKAPLSSRRKGKEFSRNGHGGKTPEIKEANCWQGKVRNLPFQASKIFKLNENEITSADVDMIIKYLENLLALMVQKYKDIWHRDATSSLSENEVDCVAPGLQENLESLQNLEKDQLRLVHREFYNLTRNVKDAFDNNPKECFMILKELERFLITHSIRGSSIIDNLGEAEVVKFNITVPVGYCNSITKYMEDVLAGEPEDANIIIDFKEHMMQKMDANSMGDCLNATPNAHTHQGHHSMTNLSQRSAINSVSTVPSSPSLINSWEDGDEASAQCVSVAPCCSKHLYNPSTDPFVPRGSKWNALIRSLALMDERQTFFNGGIRLSNAEKRKSTFSINSNFSILEIGIAADNKPVAVKILPKSDPYATLLKNQVEPLLKLRHKYILSYHTCKYENNLLIIATPLCEYNLGQYVLKMRHPQSQICKVNVIRQLLNGLMYLHNHEEPIIHGNLKPSNILIDVNGVVKVAEFGIYKAKLRPKVLPESTIIWFATELYKMYKKGLPLSCTCASDIQVAGMLVHFANNGGTHPFGRNVNDILQHLVEGTAEMTISDLELYDLLSWMLMAEPNDRPNINQVVSHVYFWSKQKKWSYVLTCAGIGLMMTAPIDIETLHASLDRLAVKENIAGNCWVMTAKKQFPELGLEEASDTPSGLLKFIKEVVESNLTLASVLEADNSFNAYILNAFPHFVLSLYRMIENSEWSNHRLFLPFHTPILDY